jgi:uncharacterized membrane protein YdcZ (DUF606 family)
VSAEPPPPPPPPPPGYGTAYGSGAQARPAPPPRPEIDPALLRPSKAWYWVAGAIGGVALVASTVLSMINTFNDFGNEPQSLEISAISWLLYFVGVGAAAIIGGITWSRRNEHKRRLQNEEMARQGLV